AGYSSNNPPATGQPALGLLAGRRSRASGGLQDWEEFVEFEGGYLAAVVEPFGAFVAEEEVEDVLAEGFGDQFAVFHRADRLGEAARQRLDAEGLALTR